MLLGNEPRDVTARAAFHERTGVDMSLHGVLDYGDGRFGIVSCGFDSELRHRALVGGTDGVIRVPGAFLTFPENATHVILGTDRGTETFTCGPVDTFQLEIEDLARAIRSGNAPLLAPDEGLHNARVIERLLNAARG
ncbi:MAG: hypothetical protein CMJ83_16675 [Planctomycetes bacterium]|nr:hypothetical protein [Planctomycetota bacterium]